MGEFYDVKIESGDFDRGAVMTVFDKETGTYLIPSTWVDSDVPAPFLATTGIMNMAKFADFCAGVCHAYAAFATTPKPAVSKRLSAAFQEEVDRARNEDDSTA